jgi:hypothetical protein
MVEDKGSTRLWNVSNFYQITWFHSQKFIILHHFLCYHDHITICLQNITIYTCVAQNYFSISLAYSTQFSKQNTCIQIAAFWDVMSCGLVGVYGHFRQMWDNRYVCYTDKSVLQAYHKKAKSISKQDGRVTTHTHISTQYNVIKYHICLTFIILSDLISIQCSYTDGFRTKYSAKFLLSCLWVSYNFPW